MPKKIPNSVYRKHLRPLIEYARQPVPEHADTVSGLFLRDAILKLAEAKPVLRAKSAYEEKNRKMTARLYREKQKPGGDK